MSACNYSIFVINLDSSVSRWRECQQQLESLQLEQVKIERISAIDGRKLSRTELNQNFDANVNRLEYHKTLTAGEIGCYLSHRKVWARIVADNLDFALVLEDDFVVTGELNELLSTVARIGQPWHCIKLTEFPIKRKELSSQVLANFRLVTYNKIPARTCAQLISHSGAKSLLASTEKFGRPVDIDLQHWWEHKLIVFGLKPYPFQINHASTSDIEGIFKRKNSKTRHFSKLYQQLYFYVENQRATKEIHF